MSILDLIKNIFSNGKKNARIITNGLTKNYGESDPLEVALYENNTPLINKIVQIRINGVDYYKTTDSNGVARLNINLNPEEYTALIKFSDDEYNNTTAYAQVLIKSDTRMEGTDIVKTASEKAVYQCAVYDVFNNRLNGTVNITVNGVPYARNLGSDGLAKLNINLGKGEYILTAEYPGDNIHNPSKVINKIIVKDDPKPEPKPEPAKLYPYITTPGGGKLGQKTGYSCGPHSLMQCIYRLTGIELSESELMAVCGTTRNGTSHQGLETGLAWFNRKYGYNLKMTWKNKSELTWKEIQWYMEHAAMLFHLCYKYKYGHYEIAENTNLKVLNSLGNYCNYPAYCGYIENRSRATQEAYIAGISQKSVCIITRG